MNYQELAQEAIEDNQAMRDAEIAEMNYINDFENGSYWGGDMEYTQEDADADQLMIDEHVAYEMNANR
jgi:hypothetical protein